MIVGYACGFETVHAGQLSTITHGTIGAIIAGTIIHITAILRLIHIHPLTVIGAIIITGIAITIPIVPGSSW